MENTNHKQQTHIEAAFFDGQSNLDVSYFNIYGLNCPRCADRVQMALSRTPGVSTVIVEFPDGLAEVAYDSKRVTVDALVQAVQAAGDGGHHNYQAQWLQ